MDVIISAEEKIVVVFFNVSDVKSLFCFFLSGDMNLFDSSCVRFKMCLRDRLAGRVWACRQKLSSLLSVFFFFVFETVFIWDSCACVCVCVSERINAS